MATQDGFHSSFTAPSLLRPWDLCPYSIKRTNLEHLRVSWFLDPTQRLSGACQWPGACSIYIKKLLKMQSSRYWFATDPSFHTGHCGPAGSLVQNWVVKQWRRVMVKYAWSRTFFLSSRLNREELVMKHENSFLELKTPSWTRPCLFCLYPTKSLFSSHSTGYLSSWNTTSLSILDSDSFCLSFSLFFIWMILIL